MLNPKATKRCRRAKAKHTSRGSRVLDVFTAGTLAISHGKVLVELVLRGTHSSNRTLRLPRAKAMTTLTSKVRRVPAPEPEPAVRKR